MHLSCRIFWSIKR